MMECEEGLVVGVVEEYRTAWGEVFFRRVGERVMWAPDGNRVLLGKGDRFEDLGLSKVGEVPVLEAVISDRQLSY